MLGVDGNSDVAAGSTTRCINGATCTISGADADLTVDRACLDGSALTGIAGVGFMAAKTADQTDAGSGAIITFEAVITNVGGGYDSTTSTFTAPYDGLYHLSAVVVSASGTTTGVTAKLYKNVVYTLIRG